MHIHKPKAPESWRAFAGEIGVIVVGILIAIGLEQTVEALHHGAQAREMAEKLRDESLFNRHVITFDIDQCRAAQKAAETDIAAVSGWISTHRPLGDSLAPLPTGSFFRPDDEAWTTIHDSALLPIMPKPLIANYWKVETTNAALDRQGHDAGHAQRQAEALLDAARERPMNEALADDLLTRLNEFRQEELGVCETAEWFREDNEMGLSGKPNDAAADLQKAGRPAAR